jgi:hypothetical protein
VACAHAAFPALQLLDLDHIHLLEPTRQLELVTRIINKCVQFMVRNLSYKREFSLQFKRPAANCNLPEAPPPGPPGSTLYASPRRIRCVS